MKKLPKKYRNPKLYVSAVALILLVLQTMGIEVDVIKFNDIANGLLGVLVLLGVIDTFDGGEKK